MPQNVLVIEDELDISQLVKLHLEDIGCQVTQAFDGIVGLTEAQAKPFDLIVLDLKLPGLDGLEVCKRLRAQGRYTPILMLTSKSSELDRVLGLEMGADDYLTKPFSVMELTARAKAILRRVDLLGAKQEGDSQRGDLGRRPHHRRRAAQRHGARRPGGADRQGVRSARLVRAAPGPGVQPRPAARPRLGLSAQRLRSHRELAHQPPARQDRARSSEPRVHPDGVGGGVQVRGVRPEAEARGSRDA